jgi:hypothetical protein
MARLTAAIALMLALPACVPPPAGPTDGPITGDPPQALETARARWDAAGVDDYSYTISRGCFCPPEFIGPFQVAVRDGAIVSATRDGAAVDTAQVQIPTVPAIFDEIAEAIEAGAAEVRVTYDATLGYPTDVWIDQDRMMADEEMGYAVTDLVRG